MNTLKLTASRDFRLNVQKLQDMLKKQDDLEVCIKLSILIIIYLFFLKKYIYINQINMTKFIFKEGDEVIEEITDHNRSNEFETNDQPPTKRQKTSSKASDSISNRSPVY